MRPWRCRKACTRAHAIAAGAVRDEAGRRSRSRQILRSRPNSTPLPHMACRHMCTRITPSAGLGAHGCGRSGVFPVASRADMSEVQGVATLAAVPAAYGIEDRNARPEI